MAKGFLDGYKTYDTRNGFGNAKKWRENMRERMTNEDAEKIMQSQRDSPNTILGISETSTLAEIKRAFRLKIREWHPDKNHHRIKEAEEMSKKIIAAYTILTS